MKNKKENLKDRMLTKIQADTVKEMIIKSMRDVYINMGVVPGVNFDDASNLISDKIIKNTQETLTKKNVRK